MTGERCGVCGTPLYSDPGAHELGIYLHARRYADAGGEWSYETELPGWALPPEGSEGVGTEGELLAMMLGELEVGEGGKDGEGVGVGSGAEALAAQ